MNKIREGYGWMASKFAGAKHRVALAAVGGLMLLPSGAQAQLTNLVAYDSGTGDVTFTPGGLVTPIIAGVIAAIGAGAALMIVTVGIRWVYRTIKGSK